MNAFYYSTHPTSAASPSPRGLVRASQCLEGLPWVAFPPLPPNVLVGTLGTAPSSPGCGARSFLHQPPSPLPEPLLFGYSVALCVEAEANALRRACSAATEVDDGEGALKSEEEFLESEVEVEVEAEAEAVAEAAVESSNISHEVHQGSSESDPISISMAPTFFGMSVFLRAQEIRNGGAEVTEPKYLGLNPPLLALPTGLFTPPDVSLAASSLHSPPHSTSHPFSPPQDGGSAANGSAGSGKGRYASATRKGSEPVSRMAEFSSSSSSSSSFAGGGSERTPGSLALFKHLAHLPHANDSTCCPSEASPTQPVGAMDSAGHTDTSIAAAPHNIFEEEEEEEEEEGGGGEEEKPTSAMAPGGDDESTAELVQMAGQGAPTDSSLTQIDDVGGMFTTEGEGEGGVGILGDGNAQPHSLGGMVGITGAAAAMVAAAVAAAAAVAPGVKEIDTSLTQIDEEEEGAIRSTTEGGNLQIQSGKEEEGGRGAESGREREENEEEGNYDDDEGEMAPTLANGEEVDLDTTVVSGGAEVPPLPPSAMDMDLSSSGGEVCTVPPPLPFLPPLPSSVAPAVMGGEEEEKEEEEEEEDEENSSLLGLTTHRWETHGKADEGAMDLAVDGDESDSAYSSSPSFEDEGVVAASTLIRTYGGGGGKRSREEGGSGEAQTSPTPVLSKLLCQAKTGENHPVEDDTGAGGGGAGARVVVGGGGQGKAATTHQVGDPAAVQSKVGSGPNKKVRFSESTKSTDGGAPPVNTSSEDSGRGGSNGGGGNGSGSGSGSSGGGGGSGSGNGGGSATQAPALPSTLGQRVPQKVTANSHLGTRVSGGSSSSGGGSGVACMSSSSSSSSTTLKIKDHGLPALPNRAPRTRGAAQALAAATKTPEG